ncbi:phosphoadenosine phosphosulfate reductase domain-containing protein [Anaerovorax sp. IOR16]|uniref:phosphoadenosine phosphosulfate reductase domain-containing protein n=1 Tax=Anaerovorax sp. IOR16 TaxID=2773458 RepID=UPI0019D137B4|nr:phosphoadenosine phosphosulfate reductase family protein [Anaerovorax sp. IOR16]
MKKTALKRKQNMSNDDWILANNHIETLVSKEELDLLVSITADEIKKATEGKKVAYAWSGGKDSVVLGAICESVGIENCVIGLCNLEYAAFVEWVSKNKPMKCTVINTGQDLEWLKSHPNMLFPQDSGTAAKWFSIVQHRAQKKYYKENKLDMLLLGRRKADGNYVGRKSNIYTDGKGITRFSPLADWKHEHILAFIHYFKLPLPPFYDWENGFKCGTHPWAARQHTQSKEIGWKEVMTIQPDLVNAKKQMEDR